MNHNRYVLIDSLGKKYTRKPGRKQKIKSIPGLDYIDDDKSPAKMISGGPKYQRWWRQQRRLELMDILGGRFCIKCGFKDIKALQFDHIHGNGKQRREQFKSQYQMISFYYHNLDIAKKEIQVMCANCNSIKKVDNQEVHRKYR